MYKYANGATIADIAKDGENLLFIAQWSKLVCTYSYRCKKGDLIENPSAVCQIDLGKTVNGKCKKGKPYQKRCYIFESPITTKTCF